MVIYLNKFDNTIALVSDCKRKGFYSCEFSGGIFLELSSEYINYFFDFIGVL